MVKVTKRTKLSRGGKAKNKSIKHDPSKRKKAGCACKKSGGRKIMSYFF